MANRLLDRHEVVTIDGVVLVEKRSKFKTCAGKKRRPCGEAPLIAAVRPPTPVTDRIVDKALRAVSDCPSTDMAAQPPSPSMMSRLAFGTSGAPSAALVRCQPLHACPKFAARQEPDPEPGMPVRGPIAC